MAVKIGYTRVSTYEQNEDLQVNALVEHGVEEDNIFKDKVSGVKTDRKAFSEAMTHLRPGDALVVWKLDRAGRSLADLINTLQGLQKRGVDFISLTENIDTTTPAGKFMFHVLGAIA